MSDEKKPLDPAILKLTQALMAKALALAAGRGLPVVIHGKVVDAEKLNAQADRVLAESAAELGARTIQRARERMVGLVNPPESAGETPAAPRRKRPSGRSATARKRPRD